MWQASTSGRAYTARGTASTAAGNHRPPLANPLTTQPVAPTAKSNSGKTVNTYPPGNTDVTRRKDPAVTEANGGPVSADVCCRGPVSGRRSRAGGFAAGLQAALHLVLGVAALGWPGHGDALVVVRRRSGGDARRAASRGRSAATRTGCGRRARRAGWRMVAARLAARLTGRQPRCPRAWLIPIILFRASSAPPRDRRHSASATHQGWRGAVAGRLARSAAQPGLGP